MSWREAAPCWPDNWASVERVTGEPISERFWMPLTPDSGWKLLAKGEAICNRFCDYMTECDVAGDDSVGVWAGGIRGMVRPHLRKGTKCCN